MFDNSWYDWYMSHVEEEYCTVCRKDIHRSSVCSHGLEKWMMRGTSIDRSIVSPSNVLLITRTGKQALFYDDDYKVRLEDA